MNATRIHIALLISCVLHPISNSFSQPQWAWVKCMGGANSLDAGRAIAADPETGDVYTTGSFAGVVDFDPGEDIQILESIEDRCYVLKHDTDGNLIWAKSISGGVSYGADIQYAPNGIESIYIMGRFEGTVDFDPGDQVHEFTSEGERDFITRWDAEGNFIWVKIFESSHSVSAESMTIIDIGINAGIYLTGSFNGVIDLDPGPATHLISSAGVDIFIAKLDNDGNFIWGKSVGGNRTDEGTSISHDAQGDIFITGNFTDTVDFNPDDIGEFIMAAQDKLDIFILKLKSSGEFVCAKSIGGNSIDIVHSIAIDKKGDGSIYLTGAFFSTIDMDPDPINRTEFTSAGARDMFLCKLNPQGEFLWARSIGGMEWEVGFDLATDPNGSGDVYVTGEWEFDVDFDPGDGIFQVTAEGHATCIFVTRFDRAGNFKWVKVVGNGRGDASQSIALDRKGYIYITGAMMSDTAAFDSIIAYSHSTGLHDILIAKISEVDISGSAPVDSISIYPSPASVELTLDFHSTQYFDVELRLYNMLGQMIYYKLYEDVFGKEFFDITFLPAATYVVELVAEEKRQVKKIIKL